jgi:hypothetical protein
MKDDESKIEDEVISLNIKDMYNYDPKKVKASIVSTHYSNQAWLQVNQRDVVIDLLQIPGFPDGENTTIPAARIYLTHSHAQKLANLILNTLKNLHEKDRLEKYEPDQ